MSRFFAASLLALGVVAATSSAYANDIIERGQLRDTTVASANADLWKFKYLGGQNIYQGGYYYSNETYDWASQRTYNNEVLDTAGYQYAVSVPVAGATNDVRYWNKNFNFPWISTNRYADDKNGFYSYVTTIDDSSRLSVYDPSQWAVSFSSLSLGFAADDHMQAIFINGVSVYDVMNDPLSLQGAHVSHKGWEQRGYITLEGLTDIPWNVDGANTIEFVIHNNNYPMMFTAQALRDNPTGLAAWVQAEYQITAIPEPETYAMMLAGLAMIGAVARRRNKSL